MTDGVSGDYAEDHSSTVKFEMNRQEVGDILSRLNDIQRVFEDVKSVAYSEFNTNLHH